MIVNLEVTIGIDDELYHETHTLDIEIGEDITNPDDGLEIWENYSSSIYQRLEEITQYDIDLCEITEVYTQAELEECEL